jgi:FkbM family methyltransferase
MNVIYDFGANNGDDIPYYLAKADLVVAVEANPVLAQQIERRFPQAIAEERLRVLNCVLVKEHSTEDVPFYVHKTQDVLSQFPRPAEEALANFTQLRLPARRASEIIREHGHPLYLKVDLEHYDQAVLEEVLSAGIRPQYLSAESHSIEIFALMVAIGGYRSFKLVDGPSVGELFKNHTIVTLHGEHRQHAFAHHAAGPFGNDIPGPWMTADNFFRLLAYERLGWKDIHATNCVEPDPTYAPIPRLGLRECARMLPSATLRSFKSRIAKAFR